MATIDYEAETVTSPEERPATSLYPSIAPCAASAILPQVQAASSVPPLVSVVIPTRARPGLLERAISSVLNQELHDLEIVVVVDGPDVETIAALRHIRDERLRVVPLNATVGGAEARNIGVRFSRGAWIALLDDDDEWLPGKLQEQYQMARSPASKHVLVASQFFERTEKTERILPRRSPAPNENISEYLFVRRGWQSAEGFVQTSTWFASRELMLKVPFTRGLKRCQDLDWLLHAGALADFELRIVQEPLAIFHHEEDRQRVSRTPDWRFLYRWGLTNKPYFTRRAFAFFIAAFCVPSAATQRDGRANFLFLLRACFICGDPNAKCLLLFLVFWLLSEERRRSIRAAYGQNPGTVTARFRSLFQPLAHKATS
jgi:glycosyltransferase involved in cell wall biosynthesis